MTGSTNADLAGAASRLESGQVLTAEEQQTGRGRSGRDWFCPPGAGLMFSTLVRLPQVPADRRGWTGALLGLAIVRALDSALGVAPDPALDSVLGVAPDPALDRDLQRDLHPVLEPQLGQSLEPSPGPARGDDLAPKHVRPHQVSLKWPNDVLLDGAKCAGILGELVDDAVVVGAGINVSLTRDELPRADATSLLLAGGVPAEANDDPRAVAAPLSDAGESELDPVSLPARLDRPALLARILDGFGDLLDTWVAARGDIDGSGLREQYRRRCSTLGARVRVILPGGGEVTATAVDVGADGALVVQDDAGRRTSYSAADVVHLRPTG